MNRRKAFVFLVALILCVSCLLVGCAQKGKSGLVDGTYQIEAETDSSMFRSDSCSLTVKDGAYMVSLTLPGEGFSKLYFGTAEDAVAAPESEVYVFYLNDEGKYTFDFPVTVLDEELAIAAYGQRRDRWYDHTIVFHAPSDAA